VEEAIRLGKLPEANKYAYFEEPVMYDDFEAIKKGQSRRRAGRWKSSPTQRHERQTGRKQPAQS
jgi:hypothetical protein